MDLYPSNPTELTLLVASIGFIGGLAGALLGFISNFINTSRQIARQERDKRREVYGRLIAGSVQIRKHANARRELAARLADLKAQAQALHSRAREAPRAVNPTDVRTLDALVTEVEADHRSTRTKHRAELEHFELMAHELNLYGDGALRDAGLRLVAALTKEGSTLRLPPPTLLKCELQRMRPTMHWRRSHSWRGPTRVRPERQVIDAQSS